LASALGANAGSGREGGDKNTAEQPGNHNQPGKGGISSGSMALADRLAIHRGVVAQLIDSFATSDQPAAYVLALDRFADWVDGTLDEHKVDGLTARLSG
jgi:hypothetical protein